VFEALYANPKKLKEFVYGMAGAQTGNFIDFAKKFDFAKYKTHCDIGGAGGNLSVHNAMNVNDKVKIVSGDFFTDEFPKADVITMGNILHDWGKKDKLMLIKKAHKALPKNGALVVIENIIDDNRSENAFGLLMSLNMLIETPKGYDFSASDFDALAKEAGFLKTTKMLLTGPSSAVIAIKE